MKKLIGLLGVVLLLWTTSCVAPRPVYYDDAYYGYGVYPYWVGHSHTYYYHSPSHYYRGGGHSRR